MNIFKIKKKIIQTVIDNNIICTYLPSTCKKSKTIIIISLTDELHNISMMSYQISNLSVPIIIYIYDY